jgi:hypothetical protein
VGAILLDQTAFSLALGITAFFTLLIFVMRVYFNIFDRRFKKDVDQERDRLNEQISHTYVRVRNLTPNDESESDSNPSGATGDVRPDGQVVISRTNGGTSTGNTGGVSNVDPIQASEVKDHFTPLLVAYYAHGLVQARRSSIASLASSTIGGAILMTGIAVGIFRADTSGGIYISVVTSSAGVLTNVTGVLFHRQAGRALAHMEGQTSNLRKDMKIDRDGRVAIQEVDKVADVELRDRLRAAVILQLARAKLPNPNKGQTGARRKIGREAGKSRARVGEKVSTGGGNDTLPHVD